MQLGKLSVTQGKLIYHANYVELLFSTEMKCSVMKPILSKMSFYDDSLREGITL